MKLSRMDAKRLHPLLESAAEKLAVMVKSGEENFTPLDWIGMLEYGQWLDAMLRRLRAHMDPPKVTLN